MIRTWPCNIMIMALYGAVSALGATKDTIEIATVVLEDFSAPKLPATLSAEGKTWNEGLLLDERQNVSYPDGMQAEDELIRIVYARERGAASEILLTIFREEDKRAFIFPAQVTVFC